MRKFLVPALLSLTIGALPFYALKAQTPAAPATSAAPAPATAVANGTVAPSKPKTHEKTRSPEEQKLYDDFMERTQEFTDKPFNDPSLEFKVRLPKTWEKPEILNQGSSTSLTRKLLGTISRFSGPAIGDIRPEFVMEALELEHEITAENWAKNFALINGFTLRELTPISEYEASGSYIYIENGVSLYIRFTAKIIGNLVILARFSVPNFAAEQLDGYMRLSIESLTMTKSLGGSIENFKPFSLRDVMTFRFPISWAMRNPHYDEDERITIELENKRPNSEKLNGLITIVAVKKQAGVTIESEVARIREDIVKTNDVTFEDLLLSRVPPSYLRFTYALQEVYKIPSSKTHISQEIWFTAYEDENWYVFLYLLTPAKEETFYDWARNTRALELILRSIE